MKLAVSIVFAWAVLSACSTPTECEATCQGCCSAEGRCLGGSTDDACGRLGAACSVCDSGKSCSNGSCRMPSGGGGGSAGGGGGSDAGRDGGTDGGTDGGLDGGSADAGARVPNPRVFVTSSLVTGDVVTAGGGGGVTLAADRICQASASDAGLGGTWRAYLAPEPESAMTRHQEGAPYLLVGTATKVFRGAARLQQAPEVALNRSEFGTAVPPSAVWTGTDPSGLSDGVNCASWSSALGSARGSVGFTFDAGAWTGAQNVTCDTPARLYCFEY